MKRYGAIVFLGLGFVLGCFSGYWYLTYKDRADVSDNSRQVREGRGVYTNPLLECDIAADTISAPKVRFERAFKAQVAAMEGREGISEIAAYYRDLNSGPAFGVNQSNPFIPASLLKVPLMMAFYKHAESEPTLLTRTIPFIKKNVPELARPTIIPEKELTDGKEYSVEELISRMLTYSDNSAMELLYPLLPEQEYASLYKNLGVDDIDPNNPSTVLNVVEYSTFFRVLFNASYLSQASSEKALKVLTQSTFSSALRAGVPFQIDVAHKFGERDLGDGYYQLHDCGIVYVPNRPYLICVMTRGTNQKALENAIRDISKFTYDQVQKQ